MAIKVYKKAYNFFLSVKEFFRPLNPFYKLKNQDQFVDLKKWELSFYDDFDGDTIDESLWMTHYYWGTTMVQFDNKQVYANSALSISNSCLQIKPQNEKITGWYYKNGEIIRGEYQISSGMIHSGESFKQKYGIFSIKCKLPKGGNLLPSAWLLDKQSWPPKLDIFEFDSNSGYRIEYGTEWGLQYSPYFHKFKNKTIIKDLTKDFHIFTCVWEPNVIKWYVDNRLVAIYCGAGIPQTIMYLVINLALDQKNEEYNNMSIDWVKVWKLKDVEE